MNAMKKYIIMWSYRLGFACVVLALVTRGLNALGLSVAEVSTRGNSIGYRSFLDGAFLFFLTAIATANYAWFKSQKDQS